MSETQCTEQSELCEVGRQQVTMTFDGGRVISDPGLSTADLSRKSYSRFA